MFFPREKWGESQKTREGALELFFARAKRTKIPFLRHSLLPNPTETLATHATLIYFTWFANNILACNLFGVLATEVTTSVFIQVQKRATGQSDKWYVVKKCACRSAIKMERQPVQSVVRQSIFRAFLGAYLYKDRHMMNHGVQTNRLL